MPRRSIPIVKNEIYHVVNRTIGGYPIFNNDRNCRRFIDVINYYRVNKPPIRYSKYLLLNEKDKAYSDTLLNSLPKTTDILCFCLMPNHFHLLIKLLSDDSVNDYVRKISNSISRYINLKRNRRGPLFQSRFRCVHIEDTDQLLHVSRYIHLNPYSSGIVKSKEELLKYPYSSFNEYLSNPRIYQTDLVIKQFNNVKLYKKFVLNHADYQRSIQKYKYLYLN